MGSNSRSESGLTFFIITIYLLSVVDNSYSLCKKESPIGYDYSTAGSLGPRNWGTLKQEWKNCSVGKQQSPINIDTIIANNSLGRLTTHYTPYPINATLVNTRHAIQVSFEQNAGGLVISGKSYELKQMHWHTPSEHTLFGVQYAAELHLVHMAEDGNFAVIAILYRYGPPDSFLSSIAEKLKDIDQEECQCDETSEIPIEKVVVNNIVKQACRYYRYKGSLTTPPCGEKVTWTVLTEVRSMSREQVELLKAPLDSDYKMNARPVQALNGRKVDLYNGLIF